MIPLLDLSDDDDFLKGIDTAQLDQLEQQVVAHVVHLVSHLLRYIDLLYILGKEKMIDYF